MCNQQELHFQYALVKEPLLLLMDEPTAAVDAASARLIHDAVAQAHRHRTMLVITHDRADLSRYDRVLELRHGRVVELCAAAPRPAAPSSPLTLVKPRHV